MGRIRGVQAGVYSLTHVRGAIQSDPVLRQIAGLRFLWTGLLPAPPTAYQVSTGQRHVTFHINSLCQSRWGPISLVPRLMTIIFGFLGFTPAKTSGGLLFGLSCARRLVFK